VSKLNQAKRLGFPFISLVFFGGIRVFQRVMSEKTNFFLIPLRASRHAQMSFLLRASAAPSAMFLVSFI
jgi:hypothetical protein